MGGVMLLVALLGPAPLEAMIYRWVDAEGVISCTNTPTPPFPVAQAVPSPDPATPTAPARSPAGLVLTIGVLGLLGSLVPELVALWRQNRQWRAMTVLNLLLGWTFVGWVMALVWAFIQPPPDAMPPA
jgi:Superinfection immunity protein/Domain of unknown function (DUF4124)